MTRTTKLIFGLIVGIAVLLVGWLIISYILAPEEPGGGRRTFLLFPSGGDETPAPGGEGPIITGTGNGAVSKLTQITTEAVTGATLSKDQSHLLFYKRAGGNLIQTDLEGKNEIKLSTLTILGILEAEWSPSREAAIVSYMTDSEIKHFIQAAATSSTIFLPKNITGATWSPDGSRIGYTQTSTRGSDLVTADAKGGNPRVVYSRKSLDWRPQWIGTTTIFMSTTPSYAVSGLSAFFTLNQGASDFISLPGLQVLPAFSTNTYAVFSSDSRGTPAGLTLKKRTGETIASTDIRTLAEKCAWNGTLTFLYCAVPEAAPAGLPDEWYKGKVAFRDRIVRINRTNGAYEELLPLTVFDAVDLFVSPDEKFLFFISKRDSTLWRLELR